MIIVCNKRVVLIFCYKEKEKKRWMGDARHMRLLCRCFCAGKKNRFVVGNEQGGGTKDLVYRYVLESNGFDQDGSSAVCLHPCIASIGSKQSE